MVMRAPFSEYTTQWIHNVNRGGLFKVNDTAYVLFRRIEACMQDNFKNVLKPTASSYNADNKDTIIDSDLNVHAPFST